LKSPSELSWSWAWNEALAKGVRLFNAREYFECHEVLEDLWRAERGPLRDLYQGLIKAAVAFYHAERGNFTGAVRVLERGLPQLEPYRRSYRRLALDGFVAELEGWLERFRKLERAGAEAASLDPLAFPLLNLLNVDGDKNAP
jgi:hypothetical protein